MKSMSPVSHTLSSILILLSSVAFAEQKPITVWKGSTKCEAIINVNHTDAYVIAELARCLMNLGLSYHPSSSFFIETGQVFMAEKHVATQNIHFVHSSCVAELQTHCLNWLENLEGTLLPYTGQNLITISNLSLLSPYTPIDPTGSGCWPTDGETALEPDTQPINDHEPDFDVRNNFVQPKPLPVLLPIPSGPMGAPQIVIIPPNSKAYPFAAEVARILADQEIEQWIKNTILAILSTGAVASILLAIGGVTNGGISTSVSLTPILAAGIAIIWICQLGDIDVDQQALKLKNTSTSSIDIHNSDNPYTIHWENKYLVLKHTDHQKIKVSDNHTCIIADNITHKGKC